MNLHYADPVTGIHPILCCGRCRGRCSVKAEAEVYSLENWIKYRPTILLVNILHLSKILSLRNAIFKILLSYLSWIEKSKAHSKNSLVTDSS
jgi:hypothetical protein